MGDSFGNEGENKARTEQTSVDRHCEELRGTKQSNPEVGVIWIASGCALAMTVDDMIDNKLFTKSVIINTPVETIKRQKLKIK